MLRIMAKATGTKKVAAARMPASTMIKDASERSVRRPLWVQFGLGKESSNEVIGGL